MLRTGGAPPGALLLTIGSVDDRVKLLGDCGERYHPLSILWIAWTAVLGKRNPRALLQSALPNKLRIALFHDCNSEVSHINSCIMAN